MKSEHELKKLLSSASLVFVGAGVAAVAKLIERIILGRNLSPGVFGEVNIAVTTMALGTTLAMIGLGQGIPRYISRFDSEQDKRGAWLTGLLLAGSISIVLAGILYYNADFVASKLFDHDGATHLLPLFAFSIPPVVGYFVGVGGIRGFENTIYKTYVGDLLYPFGRLLLLGILLILGFGAEAAGYAYLCSASVACIVAHYLLNRLIPLLGEFNFHAKEMAVFSAPLVVSSVLGDLLTRTDTVMLGYFTTSHEVGLYSAAYPLANSLLIALSSFGFLYLPLASRLDAEGEKDEITKIYQLTTKWVFIITFPAFLLFIAFPGDVISIFFGSNYTGGAMALMILSVGFFTNAAGGRNRETLSALGHTKLILAGNAVAFALNLLMNLFLIPIYGLVGAAIASAVSNIVLNLFMFVVLWSWFGISPFSRWTVRTMTIVPVLLIPPTFVISQLVSLSIITLPLALISIAIGTLVVIFLTNCLQPEDRVIIDFLEGVTNTQIPLLHGYIPDRTD